MKVSKILGCVLSLHLCVIAVLLVQPGCQTGQPPTQIHTQDRAIKSNVAGASRLQGELIPANRAGGGRDLDDAFNSGLGNDRSGFEPIDAIDPIEPIDPIDPIDSMQTVDVAGAGYQTYTVKRGDSLWGIAKTYNIGTNELYAANGLNKNSVIRVGQQIQIPVEGGAEAITSVNADAYQPSTYNQATTSYTVKRGDTLSGIARRFDTTVGALKAANGKSSDIIRVGEELTVPAPDAATSTAATTATSSEPSFSTAGRTLRGSTQTHTVKSGEYPGKIARQYGMTTKELLETNGISDPRKLRVGQELIVSGSGRASNVDSRVETVVAPAPAPAGTVSAGQPISEPVEIRVIEADPLVEGELEAEEPDDIFDNAVEIPIIRLED